MFDIESWHVNEIVGKKKENGQKVAFMRPLLLSALVLPLLIVKNVSLRLYLQQQLLYGVWSASMSLLIR